MDDAATRSRRGPALALLAGVGGWGLAALLAEPAPPSRAPEVAPGDLRLADTGWEPKPHWVETDQIVTVDTSQRALRHPATVAAEEKLRLIDESLRMMLSL